MIVGIQGTLEERLPDGAVINVGGVSVFVNTPTTTMARLGAEGQKVRLRTHLHIREDAVALFGFDSREDLQLFELLITVSGIGPKLALAVLSRLPSDALRTAIASENLEALTSVSGIGRRTAARMILELKGKIGAAPIEPAGVVPAVEDEVVAALTALGYTGVQIQDALRALPRDSTLTVEEKILTALRYLAPK